eukprot:6490326-Amphidinium_carterae.1
MIKKRAPFQMPGTSSASTVAPTKRVKFNRCLSQCTQAIDLDDTDEEDGKEKECTLEEELERLFEEEGVKLESVDPEDVVAREMHGDDG